MQLNGRNQFPTRKSKLVNSAVHVESVTSEYVYFLNQTVKRVTGENLLICQSISDYYSVPCGTNLLFLQGYLEWTVTKCTCMCFGFSGLERKGEITLTLKGNFSEKYVFFHCQPANAFNVLSSLELQSLWAKKKLATNMHDNGVSLIHLS